MEKAETVLEMEEKGMEGQIVELGEVSEETKGGYWGFPDGGNGYCFC